MAYGPEHSIPSDSSQRALQEAVDREFYESFKSSPARDRIQMDDEASRSGSSRRSWQSHARSEEERRVRQYPNIFDADPGENAVIV